MTGRAQIFRTPVGVTNPTGSSLFNYDRGSQRDGDTYSGSVTYTLSARTVITVSGDYHEFMDASRSARREGLDICRPVSEQEFLQSRVRGFDHPRVARAHDN